MSSDLKGYFKFQISEIGKWINLTCKILLQTYVGTGGPKKNL